MNRSWFRLQRLGIVAATLLTVAACRSGMSSPSDDPLTPEDASVLRAQDGGGVAMDSGPPQSDSGPPVNDLCTDTCTLAADGVCDDGGEGADWAVCAYGTDCTDCGVRPPVNTCDPEQNCGERECGSDGCGGECTPGCAAGEMCSPNGSCQESTCTPECGSQECGTDPVCGVSCGTCAAGEACSRDGQCICVPACSGSECGPDGCGGECMPGCDSGETCTDSGQCESDDPCVEGGLRYCTEECGPCLSGQRCWTPDNRVCMSGYRDWSGDTAYVRAIVGNNTFLDNVGFCVAGAADDTPYQLIRARTYGVDSDESVLIDDAWYYEVPADTSLRFRLIWSSLPLADWDCDRAETVLATSLEAGRSYTIHRLPTESLWCDSSTRDGCDVYADIDGDAACYSSEDVFLMRDSNSGGGYRLINLSLDSSRLIWSTAGSSWYTADREETSIVPYTGYRGLSRPSNISIASCADHCAGGDLNCLDGDRFPTVDLSGLPSSRTVTVYPVSDLMQHVVTTVDDLSARLPR